MNRKSFVLEALALCDLEKIYDLGSVLLEKKVPLKKASGEEILFRNQNNNQKKNNEDISRATYEESVLPFKKSEDNSKKKKKPEESDPRINSDLMMWQREAAKDVGENIKKTEALLGYKQSNQLYVVKKEAEDGKNKLKFASTFGVLVDKKQA